MNAIWAPKTLAGQVCTKIEVGIFEISIAMDDSAGALSTYSRSDIRVYTKVVHVDAANKATFKDIDVTELFVPSYRDRSLVEATPETLFMIMARAMVNPPEVPSDAVDTVYALDEGSPNVDKIILQDQQGKFAMVLCPVIDDIPDVPTYVARDAMSIYNWTKGSWIKKRISAPESYAAHLKSYGLCYDDIPMAKSVSGRFRIIAYTHNGSDFYCGIR